MAATRASSSKKKSSASPSSPSGSKTAKSAPSGELVKRFDGRNTRQPSAFAFLMQQHREVEGYFEAFEKAGSEEDKADLARKICLALTVHAQIEEEILYPPAHEQLSDEEMVDEAIVEHASAKDLIAQIEDMTAGEHLFDAKVKVLGEYIRHHVEEEETELFPAIKKTGMDLEALDAQLRARSEELMQRLSGRAKASGSPAERTAEAAHSHI